MSGAVGHQWATDYANDRTPIMETKARKGEPVSWLAAAVAPLRDELPYCAATIPGPLYQTVVHVRRSRHRLAANPDVSDDIKRLYDHAAGAFLRRLKPVVKYLQEEERRCRQAAYTTRTTKNSTTTLPSSRQAAE
jgi:hypothetical protein